MSMVVDGSRSDGKNAAAPCCLGPSAFSHARASPALPMTGSPSRMAAESASVVGVNNSCIPRTLLRPRRKLMSSPSRSKSVRRLRSG